eukprot:gene9737-9895_t
MQNLTYEEFLQTPYTNTDWWPEVMCHMPDVVFTEGNRPFKSVLEMRQKKMQNLFDLRASHAFVGVEIFRLEDVWLQSMNGRIAQYLKQRLAKYNMPFVRNCPEENVQLDTDARAGWLEAKLGRKVDLDLQQRVAASVLLSYNTTLAQLQEAGEDNNAEEFQARVAIINKLQNRTLEQQLGYDCVGDVHEQQVRHLHQLLAKVDKDLDYGADGAAPAAVSAGADTVLGDSPVNQLQGGLVGAQQLQGGLVGAQQLQDSTTAQQVPSRVTLFQAATGTNAAQPADMDRTGSSEGSSSSAFADADGRLPDSDDLVGDTSKHMHDQQQQEQMVAGQLPQPPSAGAAENDPSVAASAAGMGPAAALAARHVQPREGHLAHVAMKEHQGECGVGPAAWVAAAPGLLHPADDSPPAGGDLQEEPGAVGASIDEAALLLLLQQRCRHLQ